MQQLEFALGRTALTHGLRSLIFPPGSVMLAPDFLCDVVWPAARKAGVRIVTYPLTDALTPEWDAVTALVRASRPSALLVVHYFGQPQDLDRCRSFCDEHALRLIEDNAHGHSGTLNGQQLGTFGDIGISSPRKTIASASGGVLYIRDDAVSARVGDAPSFPVDGPRQLVRSALSRFPTIKSRLRGLLDLARNWSDPRLFREGGVEDYGIDPASHRLIATANWETIARRRRAAWLGWSEFARANGLVPVFSAPHRESCPWALPVFASDLDSRNRWLKWGSRNGVTLFPWPSLPDVVIDEAGSGFSRWKRLLCFSLDRAPA